MDCNLIYFLQQGAWYWVNGYYEELVGPYFTHEQASEICKSYYKWLNQGDN